MKKSKILSIGILITFLLCTAITCFTGCSKETDFVPVLRFAIASDVHVADSGSEIEELRLAKLYDIAYNHSKNSSKGTETLDATIFAGDFTNLGTLFSMQKFKSIVDSKIKEETKLIVALGNHEFFTDAENTESRYKSVFNTEVDEHFIISGFHFIKLSPNGEYFSETKLSWLKQELKKAAQQAPNKPIFVIQHQHVKGTVYGSTGWGVDGLYDILKDYPQVVDFSGHSHFPIHDERSLWQGDFTAVGTGTLSYVEMGLNGVSTDYVFPHGKDGDYELWTPSGESDYGVFQIVECDKIGNIQIVGYDVLSETKLFERFIKNPTKKFNLVTNEVKKLKSTAPSFADGCYLTYLKEPNGDVVLTVPQALEGVYVESYVAKVYNENDFVGSFYALSGHIFEPKPQSVKLRIQGLNQETDYTVKVYAVNSYGVLSKTPLELTISKN